MNGRGGKRIITGVDLDNTLVSYDALLFELALGRGLITSNTPQDKTAIRDAVRLLEGGEERWMELQAELYGPSMERARLIGGVSAFFSLCRGHDIPVYVISHKTRFAARDKTGTDLRAAATGWMRANGFFDPDGMALPPEHVFFESTRASKLARIRALGCTHFVDDLEETFLEPEFPMETEQLLFRPSGRAGFSGNWRMFTDWESISAHFRKDVLS